MGMLLREAEVVYTGRRIEASRQIHSSSDAAQILIQFGIARRAQESFVVMYLNGKHNCLAVQTVALGTLNSCEIHPREVFRGAIMAGAQAVIVAHNHPGGDPTPSRDDVALTARLQAVGDLVGIPVLDHLILTLDGNWQSMASNSQM